MKKPVRPRAPLDDPRTKAAIEEFMQLRGEIELRGSEQRTMERAVVLADAAIYNLLLFRPHVPYGVRGLLAVVWMLPPLIGALALVRWRESIIMIENLAFYLRRQEAALLPAAQGWETFLHRNFRAYGDCRAFSRLYYAFWIVLIGGTAGLGLYEAKHDSNLSWAGDGALGPALALAMMASAGVALTLAERPPFPDESREVTGCRPPPRARD